MTTDTSNRNRSAEQSAENKRRPDLKTLAIRGVIFNWIGRGCSFVITFFVTPIILHGLGNETYGVWSIVIGLSGYYALAGLGLRGAATKYIAEAHALGDHDRISRVIVTSVAIKLLIALGLLLFVMVIAWVFPMIFPTSGGGQSIIRWVIVIVGINFAVRLVGQPFAATLTALTRFDLVNMLSVGSQLLRATLVVLAVLSGGGLLWMAAAFLCVGLLTQFSRYFLVRNLLGPVSLSPAFYDHNMVKKLFSFSAFLFLNGGLKRISGYSGLLIVGVLLGPATTAFYSIAESLTRKTHRLSAGINTVVFPVASRLNATGNRDQLIRVLTLVPRLLLTMSLFLTVVFVFMGREFIELWLGPGYATEVYPIICILSFSVVASKPGGGLAQILKGMGRLRILTWLRCMELTLTVGLGVMFVHLHGLPGMAWAILCTRAVQGFLVALAVCKELRCPLRRFLYETIAPATLAMLPGAAAAFALTSFSPARTFYLLAAHVICVFLISAVSAYVLCVPAELRRDLGRALRPTSANVP